MIRALAGAVLVVFLGLIRPSYADPVLAFPVDCQTGVDCFIRVYPDTDPKPLAAQDYACGTLANDGFSGTLIALRHLGQMDKGVAVRAAAPGTVRSLRDGLEDRDAGIDGVPPTHDLDAGNVVVIEHDNGWTTEYAHLKMGSIAVKRGQAVKAGDKLGEVGLSGRASVPGLVFKVFDGDQPIDPFTGKRPGSGCGATQAGLWDKKAVQATVYIASGLLDSGFALERARLGLAAQGAYAAVKPEPSSPVLGFWTYVFGLQAGDVLAVELDAPDGGVLHVNHLAVDHTMADLMGAAGVKRPAEGWLPGTYHGKFQLVRDSIVILEGSKDIVLQ